MLSRRARAEDMEQAFKSQVVLAAARIEARLCNFLERAFCMRTEVLYCMANARQRLASFNLPEEFLCCDDIITIKDPATGEIECVDSTFLMFIRHVHRSLPIKAKRCKVVAERVAMIAIPLSGE